MRCTIQKWSNNIKCSHSVFLSLPTSKRSSGPVQYRTGNPRGGFPRVRGLPDYNSFVQPGGALSPSAPGMLISPKLAPTDTPDDFRPPPTNYSRTALSAHALTISRLQVCPGFHRTAVLNVRAFTILLFYS